MSRVTSHHKPQKPSIEFVPTFLEQENLFDYSNVGNNGFLLQNFYLPEEILLHILSYVDPKELLSYSVVCQNWKRLIRSERLWFTIYERRYQRKAKKLPWHLYYCLLCTNYFDTNLLENKDNVEHSKETYRLGHMGGAKEFNIKTTNIFVIFIVTKAVVRFAGRCGTGRRYYKLQWLINLRKSKLLQHILDVYKPHICLTKWGSKYELRDGLLENDGSTCTVSIGCETQSLGEHHFNNEWLDLTLTQYPKGIEGILLEQIHGDSSTKFAKLGSAKLHFDSIEPIDKNALNESKQSSTFECILEKHPVCDYSCS